MATDYTHAERGAETKHWSTVLPRPDPCADPWQPRCPACAGLKCLCRPRFFPGQLLTDEDLNRLEKYVVEKNRLQNRYLQGWGVACGLEVMCDVCDPDHVVVRTGYALSPCGDDIIVCSDQSVDVCALINSCEPREPECENPFDTPQRDCIGGNLEWVLAICYDERPVRGMTAMLGAGDTLKDARCGCGAASCGSAASPTNETCSCGTQAKPAATKPNYKPQCEPTQICEGYRFTVYPAPKQAVDPTVNGRNPDLFWAWLYANRARFGPLIERLLCCMIRAMELRQTTREGRLLDRDFAMSAYQNYAAALTEFAQDFAIHRCTLATRAQQLQVIAQDFDWDSHIFANAPGAREEELRRNVNALDQVWTEILSECFCSALLPGCPPPANTNCVPLAKITLGRGGTCRVVEVCNWSQRKLLINWVTITFWLSWLPWHRLSEWIASLCCGPRRGEGALNALMLLLGLIASRLEPPSGASRLRSSPSPIAEEGLAGSPPTAGGAGPDVERTGGDIGATSASPSSGLKEALDADNLAAYLLDQFHKLRAGGAAAAGQPGWTEVIARLANASVSDPNLVPSSEMDALSARLDAAEEKLRTQDALIAQLSKKD